MTRRTGSKDNAPRERRTASAIEKASKAARKKAAEEKQAKAAKEAFVRQMNRARSTGTGAAAGSSAADAVDDNPPLDDGDDDDEAHDSGLENDADEAQVPPDDEGSDAARPRREQRPADVEAELDDDEQLANADSSSVMGTYLKAVFDRLHSEVCGPASRSAVEAKWLLAMLGKPEAEWWLRAGAARSVCAKLGIEYGEPAYYRDIYVWLPDVRWGLEAMPTCVECDSAAEVGPHGFQTIHFGRRITALDTHYFSMSRRYKCSCCMRKAKEAKQAAEDAAAAAGLCVEACQESDDSQYTFMGYDPRARVRLPYGYGDEYPAFHTHCGGVDMAVVDLMRPLLNKGLRPDALSATMLELHTKKYTREYVKRELLLERDRRFNSQLKAEMFSSFGDKTGYVPPASRAAC